MNKEKEDERYMREALRQAEIALSKGEVPIGAVVVSGGEIIARAYNMTETLNDPTAHAEMQVITAATYHMGGKYLDQCTLYVTIEPCTMCAAALYWAHLGKLVYGAGDLKQGYRTKSNNILHPTTQVTKGIFEKECGEIVTLFFKNIRKKRAIDFDLS